MVDQALAGIMDDIGDAPVVAGADDVNENPVRLAAMFDLDADGGWSHLLVAGVLAACRRACL